MNLSSRLSVLHGGAVILDIHPGELGYQAQAGAASTAKPAITSATSKSMTPTKNRTQPMPLHHLELHVEQMPVPAGPQ
jgi:hypothetical protein